MRLESFPKTWTLLLGSAALLLTFGPAALAGPSKSCKCKVTGAVLQSEFLGYYPTCWRAWPGGERVCPVPETGRIDEGPIPLADAPKSSSTAPKGAAVEKLGPPKIETIK